MAISHNPILNRAVSTELSQNQVDEQFENLVNHPPMTVEGTVAKVFSSFVILAIAAAATWLIEPLRNIAVAAFIPLMLVAVVVGLYNSFSKNVGAVSVGIYAAVEGVFLGALTFVVDAMFPGIALQAVLATLATAGAMFFAYRTGIIKVTPGFTKVMTFAIIGYAVFALINLGFSLFGGMSAYTSQFGWLIALVGAGLAAFTLNLDFAAITQGTQQRLPQKLEWRFAFGLMSTLIWLYIEILRLLMILQRD